MALPISRGKRKALGQEKIGRHYLLLAQGDYMLYWILHQA
jgi:hypothetical protein